MGWVFDQMSAIKDDNDLDNFHWIRFKLQY